MTTNTAKDLALLGLVGKEVDTYLAILLLGSGNVSEISTRAKIKRTSVYQYLDKLLDRGLISKTVRGKRTMYAANPPRKFLAHIDERARALEKIRSVASEVLPSLEALYLKTKGSHKPQVVVREGKDGILETYREIINTWQDVYSIFTPASFFELFSIAQNHELLVRLREHEVKLYQLVEGSEIAQTRLKQKEYNSFVKSKLLPSGINFQADILVTGDRLALISFGTLTAILIEDKMLADVQRTFIKYLWEKE